MTETMPRTTEGFTTLEDLLNQEGILEEVTAAAKQRVTVLNLLEQFTQCQNVEPPKGWDIQKLRAFRGSLQHYIKHAPRPSACIRADSLQEKAFLQRFLEGANTLTGGWNITFLGKLATEIRTYLELPVFDDDLSPEVGEMLHDIKRAAPDLQETNNP